MAKRVSEDHLYVAGSARFGDLIYLLARDKGLEEREIEHTRFIGFDRGELGHIGDRNWRAVDLGVVTVPDERMVAVGEDGEVLTYVAGAVSEESITPRPIALRGFGVVAGRGLACGMKRQVFLRSGPDEWQPMHAPPPAKGENAGFEDVAGLTSNEIYAVGWNGEIWEWTGAAWVQRLTPTNVILTSVCCGGDEHVYACGQGGTLLRGRHDNWEIIEDDDVVEDLWSLAWFTDRLYVASMTDLYLLGPGGLEPVAFENDRPATFFRLSQAQGVLWSVGSSDVFAFEDGSWIRID